MSSVAYIEGLMAGAKAARSGPDAVRRVLDAYWLRYSGYVLLPGQTEIRRRTLQEWQEETDPLIQQMTGHNRLEHEPPELRRAQMHVEER